VQETFFGTYLVSRGAISEAQLVESIGFQKENNVLLGELAIKQGFLDRDQLIKLLHESDTLHLQLGQALVQKGFIQSDQLSNLLAQQANNHAFLGSALVRLGHIHPVDLEKYLENFRSVANAIEESVQAEIKNCFAGDNFMSMLEYVRCFFYRLGYLSKVVAITDTFPEESPANIFSAEQKHRKKGTHFLCFALPDEFVIEIAQEFHRTTRCKNTNQCTKMWPNHSST
jgi:hypothetical protein